MSTVNEKKKILICGNFLFPNGNAAGKRVYGVGLLLRELGYDVYFLGIEKKRKANEVLETGKDVCGFRTYSFQQSLSNKDWMRVSKQYDECLSVIRDIGIDSLALIIFYGSPVISLWVNKINQYAHKHNIKTLYDCVDWIEKAGGNHFARNMIKYVDTNLAKRKYACKVDGVIAISEYLYRYYSKKGRKVMLLPPIGRFAPIEKEKHEIVRFVYAGNVFSSRTPMPKDCIKDRIDQSVAIVNGLTQAGIPCRFDIYGVDRDVYLINFPEHTEMLGALKNVVFFHGPADNSEVIDALGKADFSILNRTVTKVTTAGFPSKVAESLCVGTPVITNSTSDIAKYISNDKNGLVIDFDTDKATEQLESLVRNRTAVDEMQLHCSQQCVFDYKNYMETCKAFFADLGLT